MEEIKNELSDMINGLSQTRDTMRELIAELDKTKKALYSLSDQISELIAQK